MDIIGLLPQIVPLVEKLGVIGLLILACAVLVWEIRRGRRVAHEKANELDKVYKQRDLARLALVKCRAACDAAGVKVDLSDLSQILGENSQ